MELPDDDGRIELRAAVTTGTLNIMDATVLQLYFAVLGNPYELDTIVKVKSRDK